jgi:hypothetical protein
MNPENSDERLAALFNQTRLWLEQREKEIRVQASQHRTIALFAYDMCNAVMSGKYTIR